MNFPFQSLIIYPLFQVNVNVYLNFLTLASKVPTLNLIFYLMKTYYYTLWKLLTWPGLWNLLNRVCATQSTRSYCHVLLITRILNVAEFSSQLYKAARNLFNSVKFYFVPSYKRIFRIFRKMLNTWQSAENIEERIIFWKISESAA